MHHEKTWGVHHTMRSLPPITLRLPMALREDVGGPGRRGGAEPETRT